MTNDPRRIYVLPLLTGEHCDLLLGAIAGVPYKCDLLLELDAPDAFAGIRRVIEFRLQRLTHRTGDHVLAIPPMQIRRQRVGSDHSPGSASPFGQLSQHRVICCINDGYEGGASVFPGAGKTLQLQRGHGVIFPSVYAHEYARVEQAERLALEFALCYVIHHSSE